MVLFLFACGMGARNPNRYNQPRDSKELFYRPLSEMGAFQTKRCKRFKLNGYTCEEWVDKKTINSCTAEGWNEIRETPFYLSPKKHVLK